MKKTILVFGRQSEIMNKVQMGLEANGFKVIGCLLDSQAIDGIRSKAIEVVAIGGGIESASRTLIKNIIMQEKPEIKIIEQWGNINNFVQEILEQI